MTDPIIYNPALHVIVPREPTEAVSDALHENLSGDPEGYCSRMDEWYHRIYKSVIESSPPITPHPVTKEAATRLLDIHIRGEWYDYFEDYDDYQTIIRLLEAAAQQTQE